MSMKTDCVYGYGFKVAVSDKCLREFALKHKDTISNLERGEEFLDYLAEHPGDDCNPKEDFSDWESVNSSDWGIYGMIADVMCAETNIRFEYFVPEDEYADEVIIFQETYPWEMNPSEKALTYNVMKSMLQRYINDLGGQMHPDFIRLEYFG